MTISDLSIELAIVIMIRILAVASPVILLARNIDPTRLGDTLAQILAFSRSFCHWLGGRCAYDRVV